MSNFRFRLQQSRIVVWFFFVCCISIPIPRCNGGQRRWDSEETLKQTNMFGDSWTHLMMKLINYLKLSSKSYVSQLLIQKHTVTFLSSHFFFGKFFPTNPPTKLSKHRRTKRNQRHPILGLKPRHWRPRHPFVTEPPRPTLTPVRPTPKKIRTKNWGQTKHFETRVLGCILSWLFFKVGGGQFVFVWFGEVVSIICFWWTCIFMVVEESCLATWQRKNAYPLQQINTESKWFTAR